LFVSIAANYHLNCYELVVFSIFPARIEKKG
jgi:hypothetical protein